MKHILLKILYRLYALSAKLYLKRSKPIIIGITGSVGKTSARMIISQVLQKYLPDRKIYTSRKNFNSEIGLVLSIFEIEKYTPNIKTLLKLVFKLPIYALFKKPSYDILILEYGIDTPNDMDFLLKIAKPDYAVFTKLDYIHSQNFPSKIAVGEEKMKLLQSVKKKSFINFMDDFCRDYSEHLGNNKVFYNNTERKFEYEVEDGEIYAHIDFEKLSFMTNILGEENVVYIELAFTLLSEIDANAIITNNSFLELENQKGRFSILSGKYDSVIVDSSYNAGLESMKQMIKNTCLLQETVYMDKKVLFVLGDMRETGDNAEKIHKELYDFAKKRGKIISVGKETALYFGKHLGNFKYARQAGEFLKTFLKEEKDNEHHYIILFKGSQNTIFLEEAIKVILRYKKDTEQLVRQESYWKKENF